MTLKTTKTLTVLSGLASIWGVPRQLGVYRHLFHYFR
jgi:hypothetical protein